MFTGWVQESQRESELAENSPPKEDSKSGTIKTIIKDYCARVLRIPSWVVVWLRALSSKKSVSNPNSLTPLSERA